jgi:polysaccharide biosynthesis protein PslH
VKAIEALRRGKALVSSSIGVQGFPAQARELLAIADEPAAFADLATRLLLDPAARRRSERRAARALPLLPTWDRAAEALAGTYDELLLGQQGLAARRGRVPEELSPQELAV